MSLSPPIGADGFYHPSNENELIALVQKAAGELLEIRCRGAAHSLAHRSYSNLPSLHDRASSVWVAGFL